MIKIICSGKIKENYLKDAIVEYSKRISKYDKLEIIELPDYDYDLKKTLQKEKENILKNINLKDYNILLDLNGKSYTSLELADKLDKVRITNSNITFLIGSSNGLDEEIKKLTNKKISFSRLTFPHQLFRIILLEQIYRCFKIINHEEYHK